MASPSMMISPTIPPLSPRLSQGCAATAAVDACWRSWSHVPTPCVWAIHRDQLAKSLSAADAVWIYQPDDLSWDIHEVTASLGGPSVVSDDVDELVASIVEQARAGDRLVVMSNGGFGGIHEKLLAALGKLGMNTATPFALAVTGASGAPYALRLLESSARAG